MDTVGVTSDDVIYTALPLYHSAASLIGVGTTVQLGELMCRSPEKGPCML